MDPNPPGAPPPDVPPQGPAQGPPPGPPGPPYGMPPQDAGSGSPPPYGTPQQGSPYGMPPQVPYRMPPQGRAQEAPPYGMPPQGQPPYGAPWPTPYGAPPAPAGRSRTGLVVGLLALGLVLIISIVVTAFLLTKDDTKENSSASKGGGTSGGSSVPLPAGVTVSVGADGTVTMAKPGVTAPLVDVYEDFQCPVCKAFHQVNDATLKDLAGQGKAKVVFHAITIFQDEPLAGNSLRAAAAAHCVRDGAAWLAFQDRLFANQPPEGSPGFAVEDLIAYGAAAGVNDAEFATCVRGQRYAADVRAASQKAIADGLVGTPTVKVDGKTVDINDTMSADGLRHAIDPAG